MPTTISSIELRNEYDDVSRTCHERMEPVLVTKNGERDLVVMSVEAYEAFAHRSGLVAALARGREDAEAGRTMPSAEAVSRLRSEFAR